MIYKGFDISFHQPMMEKCGIDNKGNVISLRDAWQTGDGWYQAERGEPHKIIRVKSGLDRLKYLIDCEGEANGYS